jgi:septal ring factor EnvC (AmiA/AmiB activator)
MARRPTMINQGTAIGSDLGTMIKVLGAVIAFVAYAAVAYFGQQKKDDTQDILAKDFDRRVTQLEKIAPTNAQLGQDVIDLQKDQAATRENINQIVTTIKAIEQTQKVQDEIYKGQFIAVLGKLDRLCESSKSKCR